MGTREGRNAWGVRLAGYALVSLGVAVLIGWIGNIGFLMAVLPGRITMKPNTAIGFLCAGVCILLLLRPGFSRRTQRISAALAAVVLSVGLLTLLEYFFHLNLGLDQLLFKDAAQFPYPGRMAHITALNYCLSGTSLLLLSLSPKQARWPQLLSLLTGLSAMLAIVGYIYGVPLLYGSVRYTSMALHTGVGFLLISLATLHCRPAEGLMSVVSSPLSGGSVCRVLIPFAIVAPILLGAIYLHGRFFFDDVRLALACLMVSQIVLFVVLIWALGLRLNRADLERESAKRALHHSEDLLEQTYRSMFDEAVIGIFRSTPDGRFLTVNRAMAHIFGYDSPQEVLNSISNIAHQVYVDPVLREEFKRQLAEIGEVRDFECEVFRKDGSRMWISASARAVKQDGVMLRYDGTFEDITKRKTLEDQLRQAQKMEAVGRLAGGIAHDFNNAIGVIVGYGALLKDGLADNDTMRRYAEEVGNAGHRAAALTRQLLAFSRKQVIQPSILDLNAVVGETEKMLRRLIGEDIELVFVRESNLARMKADRGQITQILMNLAINARDAMPQGGKLTIQTENAELDETNLSQHVYAKPGRYVMLSVTDTGFGMDKETQAHIFEPFFTTKEEGRGTGLGLSMVYGVVKQSGGYIWVYSEPGKGARFKIYFPRVEGAADPAPQTGSLETPGGTETILLVEDDDAMRGLTTTCLRSAGYTVLDVQNGEAGIRVASEHPTIHLLLTDVVMPGINGPQLAKSLMPWKLGLKVLFMSGYTADLIAQHGILDADISLIEKPFTKDALLRKVRHVLDHPMSRAAGAS